MYYYIFAATLTTMFVCVICMRPLPPYVHPCTTFLLLADREFADGGRQPPRGGTRAAAAKPAGGKHICKVSSYLLAFLHSSGQNHDESYKTFIVCELKGQI